MLPLNGIHSSQSKASPRSVVRFDIDEEPEDLGGERVARARVCHHQRRRARHLQHRVVCPKARGQAGQCTHASAQHQAKADAHSGRRPRVRSPCRARRGPMACSCRRTRRRGARSDDSTTQAGTIAHHPVGRERERGSVTSRSRSCGFGASESRRLGTHQREPEVVVRPAVDDRDDPRGLHHDGLRCDAVRSYRVGR